MLTGTGIWLASIPMRETSGNQVQAPSFVPSTPGEPLLFKLHSPEDFIVGGGFFSHFTTLPASFAWRAFSKKNGAATEHELRLRIEKYRRVSAGTVEDYLMAAFSCSNRSF
jgi:hypothetical protein